MLSYYALREKCPYSGLFWSTFSRIWTKYGEILRISPYSVRMWVNTDQSNPEYGHFLRSDVFKNKTMIEVEWQKCWRGYINLLP